MAIPSNTIWEVRTGGNVLNGGGFVTGSGGTDYSLQDSAQLSVADGSSSSTTNLNSATGGFTAAMVGNVLCISGGTLTAGRYRITAYVDTNNVTLDRALNTGSGSTVNVGGALSTPEDADPAATYAGYVAGNTIYIASGTYTKTSTRTLTVDGDLTGGEVTFIGYPAGGSRSDIDIVESDMPVFTSATNSVVILTTDAVNRTRFRNIKCTHTAATRGVGFGNSANTSAGIIYENCIADGCSIGFYPGSGNNVTFALYSRCLAKNCVSAGFYLNASPTCRYEYCVATGTTAGPGFGFGSGNAINVSYYRCISSNNKGNAGNGWSDLSTTSNIAAMVNFDNCLAYGNVAHGWQYFFTTGGYRNASYNNCMAVANSGFGVRIGSTGLMDGKFPRVRNFAYFNNTSGNYSGFKDGDNIINLLTDPFTLASTGNFTLNTNISGGRYLKGSGYPSEIGPKSSITTNFDDVGVAQHSDNSMIFILGMME